MTSKPASAPSATCRYHMGIRGGVSRKTLANANQARDWKIYAAFAQYLIHIARVQNLTTLDGSSYDI